MHTFMQYRHTCALTTFRGRLIPGPVLLAANKVGSNQRVAWVAGEHKGGAREACPFKHMAIFKVVDCRAPTS